MIPVVFTNSTKTKLTGLVFANIDLMNEIKNAVLGDNYDLTLSVIGTEHIQTLNRTTRGIDTPTDILSFPLDEETGEIYINLECARTEAEKFDRTYENFLSFLLIHGMVHLKGIDHGSTMERIEARFRKEFGV